MATAAGSRSSGSAQEQQARERKRRSSNSHQYCAWAESAVSSNSQLLPDAAGSPMLFLDRHGNELGPTGSWIEVETGSRAESEEGGFAAEGAEVVAGAQQAPAAWRLARIPVETVLLHVYDIGEEGVGAAELLHAFNEMSTMNNSVFIGGIFHAGVEIYGREWAYGANPDGSGVYESLPRADWKHTYRATVLMGLTALSQEEVSELLARLAVQWPGDAYHMVHHNCLSFCNTLCKEVGVGCVPSWIDRAPRTAAYIDNALQAAEESLQETGVPDASLIASEALFQAAEQVRRYSVQAAGVVGEGAVRAVEVMHRVYDENTVAEDASQALQDAGQAIDDVGTAIEEALIASVAGFNDTVTQLSYAAAAAAYSSVKTQLAESGFKVSHSEDTSSSPVPISSHSITAPAEPWTLCKPMPQLDKCTQSVDALEMMSDADATSGECLAAVVTVDATTMDEQMPFLRASSKGAESS